MGTIRTYTADYIDEIRDALIVSGSVDSSGHLKLVRNDATEIDAGSIRSPAGSVTMFAGLAIPSGWLICNGAAISRVTYSGLFAAIGTRFGAGDNTTTFNLPNMVAAFPRGAVVNPGESGGSDTHTHTIGAHSHTVPVHNHPITAHDHNLEGGSIAAHAQVRIITGAGPNIIANRLSGVPNWPGTQSADLSNTSGDTNTVGYGTKVAGRTANGTGTSGSGGSNTDPATAASDPITAEPPYLSFHFIIKT